MHSLQNKVAIVTGGANGIGASIVKAFVNEGAKFVAIVDVAQEAGTTLEENINSKYGAERAKFFKCDVTNDEQLQDVFDNVLKKNEVIDLVVNNAGIADESRYKKLIEINLTAVITSSFKAFELMRVDYGGKGGTIINVASITALSKDIGVAPVYAATKCGVLQLSNRIGSGDLHSRAKVRVLAVCFGATDTDILSTCKSFDPVCTEQIKNLRNQLAELAILQTADEAAEGVVQCYKIGSSGGTFLIESGKTLDISDKIDAAYKTMSQDVNFEQN